MLQVQTTNTFEKYTDDIVCKYDTRKHIEYDEYDANKVHGLNYVQFMQKSLLAMMEVNDTIEYVDDFVCSIIDVDVTDWKTPSSLRSLFRHCEHLQTIRGLETWDISRHIDISWTFCNCHFLKCINISSWDTSNVTNMESLFEGCSSLTILDLHNWNTSNVTNMFCMFVDCEGLTSLNVSNWNTSKVTNTASMFAGCESLTILDLHNWNTSNVTDMSFMFAECKALQTLDVSNFKINQNTNISHIFSKCSPSLNIICNDEDTKTLLKSKLPRRRIRK